MSIEARKIRLIMELRQQGIIDKHVLSSIERIAREDFVPVSFRDQAYENTALPIGQGQTISQPSVVGYMTQALEIGSRMKILEIGTGCGYQAAVLAKLCRRVYTIERYRELFREAEIRLRNLRISNVVTKWGNGMLGWPEQAPFDRIILTAAPRQVPEGLFGQLSDDGILVAPIGKSSHDQVLVRYRKTGKEYTSENLWRVRFVPLLEGTVDDINSAV